MFAIADFNVSILKCNLVTLSLNFFKFNITLTLPSFLGRIKMFEKYPDVSFEGISSIICFVNIFCISFEINSLSWPENSICFGIKNCWGCSSSSIL